MLNNLFKPFEANKVIWGSTLDNMLSANELGFMSSGDHNAQKALLPFPGAPRIEEDMNEEDDESVNDESDEDSESSDQDDLGGDDLLDSDREQQ
jgi:hypothetical protein